MTKLLQSLVLVAGVGIVLLGGSSAEATVRDRVAYKYGTWFPWHQQYANPVYHQPLALVVPPTAGNTTEYGWGVGATRITPNYHQFMRPYPGPGVGGGHPFYHQPMWPRDTTNFGHHYIRGPW